MWGIKRPSSIDLSHMEHRLYHTEPLYNRTDDVLPQDLVKSRSRGIRVCTFPNTLKFDRPIGSSAAEMTVKSQSDTIIITADSKVRGANMCPPGSCRPQIGPMLVPLTLLSGQVRLACFTRTRVRMILLCIFVDVFPLAWCTFEIYLLVRYL